MRRAIPKDGFGERRDACVKRLREKLNGLRDLLRTCEAVPFEQRDLKQIRRLTKKIQITRTGLRSAGDEFA